MSNQAISLDRPQAGPLLAALLTTALVGICAAAYWNGAGSIDAVRLIDRLTIRMAVVFFSLVFAAASLRSLFPGKLTHWLFANRRNMTIAFVVAFALHLCAIARFYSLDNNLFWSVSPTFLIALRGVGVAFIGLLFFQSLRDSGANIWSTLGAFGSYYIWAAFFAGFAKRIVLDQFYLLPAALLIAVLVLRVSWLMRQLRSD